MFVLATQLAGLGIIGEQCHWGGVWYALRVCKYGLTRWPICWRTNAAGNTWLGLFLYALIRLSTRSGHGHDRSLRWVLALPFRAKTKSHETNLPIG